ncbi:MAG TPA: hypothetical protein VGN52_00515 [Burkholderiales bacterium]
MRKGIRAGAAATWLRVLLCLCCAYPSLAPAATPAAESRRIAWLWDGAGVPAWSAGEVALVVRHVFLRGDKVLLRPRSSTPALAPQARVIPVVHVQLSGGDPPRDLAHAQETIVTAMLEAARMGNAGWVQLDLEARPSQRADYLALVREIRARLPAATRLSVTALAWWCRDRRWLAPLAADEVVPMYFRMGRDSARLRAIVAGQPRLLAARCNAAAGFSMQEPFAPEVTARYPRTYWFDDLRWKTGAEEK